MIVLILIVAAAALLAVGIGVDSTVLDAVALSLAALGAMIVLVTWVLPFVRKSAPGVEVAPAAEAEMTPELQVEKPVQSVVPNRETSVVFVAGRTTFHLDSCSLVAGKTTGRAQRSDLEAGGMAACKRCIKN